MLAYECCKHSPEELGISPMTDARDIITVCATCAAHYSPITLMKKRLVIAQIKAQVAGVGAERLSKFVLPWNLRDSSPEMTQPGLDVFCTLKLAQLALDALIVTNPRVCDVGGSGKLFIGVPGRDESLGHDERCVKGVKYLSLEDPDDP